MATQQRRSLLWGSLLLLLVGGMVGSPEAGVAVAALSALCTVPSLLPGTRWIRGAAVLLLLASVALAVTLLPAARRDLDTYRRRALTQPSGAARP